jgi:hypothetical protein
MLLLRRKPVPIQEILLPAIGKLPNIKINLAAAEKRSGGDRRKSPDRRRIFMELPLGFADRRSGDDRRTGYDRREFVSL